MTELYRIHFGFSRSKRYPPAVELSKLAYQHETRGEGEDIWHIVSFTDSQIDLMAALYKLLVGKSAFSPCFMNISRPKIYGADILSLITYCRKDGQYDYAYHSQKHKGRIRLAAERLKTETGKSLQDLARVFEDNYWEPARKDIAAVEQRIIHEGYIDFQDASGELVKATKKPKEYIAHYQEVRDLISGGKYVEALQKYYAIPGDRFYGELTGELIYLKRLASIPLTGRDLLYFRSESSRNEFIASNLVEYVSCIDEILGQLQGMGRKSLLDILLEYAPTMETMIEQRKQDWHKGVYLWDGEFKRDSTPVNLDSFSVQFDACPWGRLFDRYPDQVQHCRIIEYPPDTKYMGLWATYSPSCYQTEILNGGLHLNGIDAYRHKSWKRGKREPDFIAVTSISEIEKSDYGTDGIRYTGRSHRISEQEFYEIDLLRKDADRAKDIGNPFIELIEEILREAENLLRDKHSIPRIGEGWVSEMELYDLIKTVFPEVQHHAAPEWLKPQHLDVFVPSRKLAFEYQGKQHFEPIDFFGGQESFENTVNRDRLKAQKCKAKGVILIPWLYTEPIDQTTLMEKLRQVGVNIP